MQGKLVRMPKVTLTNWGLNISHIIFGWNYDKIPHISKLIRQFHSDQLYNRFKHLLYQVIYLPIDEYQISLP